MALLTLADGRDVVAETEVRRSRFLAVLRRVRSEDEARALVTECRSAHPTARHHCSAFVVEVAGANRVERSSDDGEPAGTAGMPILEALRVAGLTDVAAVVVRYFGGTKLGTGGLVRAYGDAVRAALADAPVVALETMELWRVSLPHADAGRVEADLRAHGVVVETAEHRPTGVVLVLATDDGERLGSLLASLTAGRARPEQAGTTVVERAVHHPDVR